MKIVVYSDAHVGGTAQYGKLMQFCEYIETYKPDMVLGVGDNLELVWRTWTDIIEFEPAYNFLLRAQEIAAKTTWVEIPGNHNENMRDFSATLYPIKISNHDRLVADGVTYIHGHQFDPVTKFWWMPLQRLTKCILPNLHDRLFGTPLERKLVGADTSYSRLVALVERNVQLWSEGRSVVFGHTHSEFIKQKNKQQFIANCGDFYDSSSFLVVSDGKPELRWI